MKSREFYKLFNQLLPPLLIPHGFTKGDSKKARFHRLVGDQVYHVICPWLTGRGGQWFDIKVLAISPLIDIRLFDNFPDNLGMPTDRLTGLEPNGMTLMASHVFRGNKSEGLIRNFNAQAKPAIVQHAIPYLDKIDTLKKLRKSMRQPDVRGGGLSYALAHWHTGKRRKGKKLLLDHRDYLLQSMAEGNYDQSVKSEYNFDIEYIEKLLGT